MQIAIFRVFHVPPTVRKVAPHCSRLMNELFKNDGIAARLTVANTNEEKVHDSVTHCVAKAGYLAFTTGKQRQGVHLGIRQY